MSATPAPRHSTRFDSLPGQTCDQDPARCSCDRCILWMRVTTGKRALKALSLSAKEG